MKETDLRGKSCVMPVALVAGIGMAGMGLVSSGIAVADTTSTTDTLSLAVEETCTFKNTTDATFVGLALNGSEVENFNDSGVHTFYLFCNNNNGYTVSATPYDLTATNTDDVISYTENYTHTGADGMWTAAIATSEAGVTVTTPVPAEGGVVLSSSTHSSDSMSFTATYNAYVGTKTSAGTYTGRIEYVLSSLSGTASNGGNNSGSGGDNGGSGANTGNETTDNTDNNGGSGDLGSGTDNNSGSGDSGTNGVNTDANSGDSGNMPSNTPNNAPLAMSPSYSTYNTYNTSNTYNTTNNTNSGTGTTGTQAATSGDTNATTSGTTNGTTSNGNSNKSGSDNGYEKPLGVTTTTSSSNEDSGFDPMPLVVTGAALAVAGVGAVALAKSNKEEEEKK